VPEIRGVPDSLVAVIRRATAAPEARYPTIAALFEGVEAVVSGLAPDRVTPPLVHPEALVRAEAHLSEPPARAAAVPTRPPGPASPLGPPPPEPVPAPPSAPPRGSAASEAATPHIASVPTVIRETGPPPPAPPPVGADTRWLWLVGLLAAVAALVVAYAWISG
jgi:hypothetical protein